MKKTLIAMTVAASAMISGSAMAGWQTGGSGGSVELSGTLTPAVTNPLEVFVGDAVTGLDATGITPQIDYQGVIDNDNFSSGVAPLTLELKNADDDSVIGTLTGDLTAGGIVAWDGLNSIGTPTSVWETYGNTAGKLFAGGLPDDSNGVLGTAEVLNRLGAISSEFIANFPNTAPTQKSGTASIAANTAIYNVVYGSGIESGTNSTLNLNTAVSSTAIKWKATLPVTVTYA
ncbi:hypothetical protein [Escherichia coli]|uniref:F4 family fimbrial subunit n=1 Tax=Escherichia coli TaxID=562 RepID=UPI001C40350B|nr:hypothetical protein [Escherichia coli]